MGEIYRNSCRACMSKDVPLRGIFETIDSVPISIMLTFISSLDIKKNDGLPDTICSTCFNSLLISYEFQQMCINSDMQMRASLTFNGAGGLGEVQAKLSSSIVIEVAAAEQHDRDYGNQKSEEDPADPKGIQNEELLIMKSELFEDDENDGDESNSGMQVDQAIKEEESTEDESIKQDDEAGERKTTEAKRNMDLKRRKKSQIWEYFTVVDSYYAKCDICKNNLCYKTSVTNLKRHMFARHPTVKLSGVVLSKSSFGHTTVAIESLENYGDVAMMPTIEPKPSISTNVRAEPMNQQRNLAKRPALVQDTLDNFVPKVLALTAKQKMDEDLMYLFTIDFQPFSIVEDYGFKRYSNGLNPSYVIPNRRYISNIMLPALYDKVLMQVKLLSKTITKCSLTADCWTSSNNENFIGITAHFIDDDFFFKSFVLGCVSYNETHNGLSLAKILKESTDEWNLSEKICLAVSDNAANMKSAIITHLGWNHFGCLAHTINLVLQTSLKFLSSLIAKVRKIVVCFKRSSATYEQFLQCQQNTGKEQKKLLLDVVTRWNSTYYMLERVLELQDAVKITVALIDQDLPVLSTDDWEIMEQAVKVLKPFEAFTKITSGHKYVTASLVVVLIRGLKNVVEQLENGNNHAIVQSVISTIKSGLSAKFDNLEINNTLCIATFLDPRFKNIAFQSHLTADRVKENVISAVASRICHEQSETSVKPVIEQHPIESVESELNIWSIYDKDASQVKPVETPTSSAIIEVQRYLEDKLLSRNEDPLLWWRHNKHNYPNLCQIARENLCAIATSMPYERLFSKAGNVLNERRARLQSRKVEQIIFLNQNLRLFEEI